MEKNKKSSKNNKNNNNNKEEKKDEKLGTCQYIKAKHILCEKFSHIEEIYKALTEAYGNYPPSSEFAKFAMDKSECSSKKRGGDLGYFGRGTMHGDFEKAAFNLQIGQMSEIVKTTFGYHIILVEDRKNKL